MAAAGEPPRPSTSTAAQEQELVLADVELDFVQLRRLEGPAEVFAAAPPAAAAASAAAAGRVLASVHNTPVPDHGAWVARLLPGGGAPAPFAAGPEWLEVPAATDAPLAAFEDDLILLSEEWWTLGFRFAIDIEVRAVVNWNGFQALADGLLRLFVLPGDGGPARAVLTTGHRLRARLAAGAGPDPPALDLVVDAVAAPPAGPIPATLPPFEAPPPREPDKLTGLFPHQKRALAWALALEAADGGAFFEALESVEYAGRRFAAATAGPGPGSKMVGWPTRAHGASRVRRPRGGLLAYPVGAGKSVIAVHLVKRSPRGGPTLVLCPDHLVDQWLSYFRTHAPELRAGPALQAGDLDVAVAGHGGAADAGEVRELLEATAWLRLVVDEPQELGKAETAFCVGHVRAAHRWCLTATPGDLHAIARLVLGTEIGRPAFRRLRREFVRRHCRRDSPANCLPTPPVAFRAHAVTLSWQEASVVRLWSVDGNVLPGRATRMDALIRLCSYFGAEEGESGAGLQFGGLEEWSAHHVALHKQRLAHLQTIRIPQLALELEKLGAALDGGAGGDANILDVLDDLTTQEALDDRPEWELETAGAGEGPTAREREILGLSAEQLGMLAPEQRQEAVAVRARLRGLDDLDWTSLAEEFGEARAAEALQAARLRAELARARRLEEANERALRFLDETAAALSNPQAECNVCLEPLRGKQVAVLQCLHAFCGRW